MVFGSWNLKNNVQADAADKYSGVYNEVTYIRTATFGFLLLFTHYRYSNYYCRDNVSIPVPRRVRWSFFDFRIRVIIILFLLFFQPPTYATEGYQLVRHAVLFFIIPLIRSCQLATFVHISPSARSRYICVDNHILFQQQRHNNTRVGMSQFRRIIVFSFFSRRTNRTHRVHAFVCFSVSPYGKHCVNN